MTRPMRYDSGTRFQGPANAGEQLVHVAKHLLQIRLTSSIPWFMIAMGALGHYWLIAN